MPRGDGTGPRGDGPKTGRGSGDCKGGVNITNNASIVVGQRLGLGRRLMRRFRRGFGGGRNGRN